MLIPGAHEPGGNETPLGLQAFGLVSRGPTPAVFAERLRPIDAWPTLAVRPRAGQESCTGRPKGEVSTTTPAGGAPVERSKRPWIPRASGTLGQRGPAPNIPYGAAQQPTPGCPTRPKRRLWSV